MDANKPQHETVPENLEDEFDTILLQDTSGSSNDDRRDTRTEFEALSYKSRMMALRMKNPYLSIAALPDKCVAIALVAATPFEFIIPDGTVYIRLTSDGHFGITRTGTAAYPTVAPVNQSIYVQNDSTGIIIDPVNQFWYVNDIQGLSMISQIGCNVSVLCYTQE